MDGLLVIFSDISEQLFQGLQSPESVRKAVLKKLKSFGRKRPLGYTFFNLCEQNHSTHDVFLRIL